DKHGFQRKESEGPPECRVSGRSPDARARHQLRQLAATTNAHLVISLTGIGAAGKSRFPSLFWGTDKRPRLASGGGPKIVGGMLTPARLCVALGLGFGLAHPVSTSGAAAPLSTPWTETAAAGQGWQEYPRPLLARARWLN